MIIGGKLIKLFLKTGWIYCSPAPQMITENSLDVTLGQNFWRPIYTRDEMEVGVPANAGMAIPATPLNMTVRRTRPERSIL